MRPVTPTCNARSCRVAGSRIGLCTAIQSKLHTFEACHSIMAVRNAIESQPLARATPVECGRNECNVSEVTTHNEHFKKCKAEMTRIPGVRLLQRCSDECLEVKSKFGALTSHVIFHPAAPPVLSLAIPSSLKMDRVSCREEATILTTPRLTPDHTLTSRDRAQRPGRGSSLVLSKI